MPTQTTITKARNYCHTIGRRGEDATANFLEENGWDILCRNYQAGKQELDIVARHKGILHFVEVKTRRDRPFAFPAMAVNFEKRKNIITAAHHYFREIRCQNLTHQYDIAEVLTKNGRVVSINILENAFSDKPRPLFRPFNQSAL